MSQHNHRHQPPVAAGRRLIPSSEYKRVVGDISEMTRWRHEKAGIGPMPVRRGGRNFYFQDEVQAYLDHLAATRQHNPDENSADAADVNKSCLAERTAAQ